MAVKDLEKSIKDDEEIVDDCVTAEDVKVTKHNKIIKICSEIVEIKKKLGFVLMGDLVKIAGKEFFPNYTTSIFDIPRSKKYIEVLEILNNISTIANTLSKESGVEELVKRVEDQFDKLNEIAESFDEEDHIEVIEDEPSDPKVHSCKTDYDKIVCKLYSAKSALSVVSLADVVKVIDEEMIPNVCGKDSFTQRILGDQRFINVLDIMNKIVSITNYQFQDKNTISALKGLLYGLEETIKSLDLKPNQNDKDAEDKKLFSTLEYLDSIKKSKHSVGTNDLLKAFVIGKIVANESESIFLSDSISSTLMIQLCSLINAPNFDINNKVQIDTCKSLISAIKQAVLRNKAANKIGCFVNTGKPFPFPNTMTINPLYGTGFDGINFEKANIKSKDIPGIDPKIYQKAKAFDKLVEALRPILDELTN